MKHTIGMAKSSSRMYDRIRRILESARSQVARSVNTTQVIANWLIGREIVEEEQKGRARAEYGKRLIENLSKRLAKDFGRGFAVRNLETFRAFYLGYPEIVIPHAVSTKFWKPGLLHPNLSWTHYRVLLRVDKSEARSFYEIEAVKNNWASPRR